MCGGSCSLGAGCEIRRVSAALHLDGLLGQHLLPQVLQSISAGGFAGIRMWHRRTSQRVEGPRHPLGTGAHWQPGSSAGMVDGGSAEVQALATRNCRSNRLRLQGRNYFRSLDWLST